MPTAALATAAKAFAFALASFFSIEILGHGNLRMRHSFGFRIYGYWDTGVIGYELELFRDNYYLGFRVHAICVGFRSGVMIEFGAGFEESQFSFCLITYTI